jgi:hypothetical protein
LDSVVDDPLSRCHWPALAAPYAAALREAVEFIFGATTPLGIIATGTIIRGNAHATSDLDIYVLHDATFRRRIQRFFRGVPTEIFINPPHTVRSYFAEEHEDGRRLTAHMLATGFVVYDAELVVEQLRTEAGNWLARPTIVSPEQIVRARYAAATRLEDGADVTATDGPTAAMLLTQAVIAMLELWLQTQGEALPRAKEFLAVVAARDAEMGRLATAFFSAVTPAERLATAHAIGDRTIGARGFFPWDSGADPVAPAASSGAIERGPVAS